MSKLIRVVKSVVLVGFVSVAGLVFAGNTCTWIGNGSDNKWSNGDNWDILPVSGNGDELVMAAGTTENDIEGIEIKKISFPGSSAATLNGKTVVFSVGTSSGTAVIENEGPLTFNAPFTFKDGVKGCIKSETPTIATIDFNGAVNLGEGAVMRIGVKGSDGNWLYPKITFNAPVVGTAATVIMAHGQNNGSYNLSGVWFNDLLNVKYLSSGYGSSGNNLHVCKPGSFWELSSVQFAIIVANAANVFPEHAVLGWRNNTASGDASVANNYLPDGNSHSLYDLNGYDQTIDRIHNTDTPNNWGSAANAYRIRSDEPATLTMKATGNATSYAQPIGRLSIVWDPQGDYTLSFKRGNAASQTTGGLTVKGGTVRVDDTGALMGLSALDVRAGASFVLDTTTANALNAIGSIALAANATFQVTDRSVTPFGSATPALSLRAASSHLVIPAGMTLTVGELMLDGLRIYGKTYKTGDEGCGWLTGGGTLVVAAEGPHAGYSWRNALDGDWSTAVSWLGGVVPGQTDAAEVAVPYDGNYAAKISGDLTYDGDLTVANDLGGTATVEVVSGTWTRGGTKLELNKGGAIAVDNGATLKFLADYSGVAVNGGSLTVKNGGMVDMTANPGASTLVSGGGVVRVDAGGYLAYKGYNVNGDSLRYFNVGAGGKLEIAGCGWFRNYGYWGHGLYMSGGAIEATGTGVLDVKVNSQGGVFGDGTVTLKDSSALYLTNAYARAQIPTGLLNVHEETTINFEDHAKLTATSYLLLGNNRMGKPTDPRNEATLNFNSDATSTTDMIYLGVPNGLATISLANGTLRAGASIQAGSCLASSTDCSAYYTWAGYTWKPEGRINVKGGNLSVVGSSYNIMVQGSGSTLVGLILGNGVTMPNMTPTYAADYDAKGSLNLSGGTVTIKKWGSLIVGGGYGSGTVDQTGGTLSKEYTSNEGYPVIIGFLSGTGSYTMGGGTAMIASPLYVGGVTKETLGWNGLVTTGSRNGKSAVDCDVRNAATGTLTVTGGTLTVAKDLVVSADGTGTVNVGEGGSLSAANITLNANSSVNYKLGPTGSGLVSTTGTLTIAPGTKLTVDARDYAGPKGVKLMSFGTKSGDFAAADVTFLPPAGRSCRLVMRETGISITSGVGAMVIVR